HHLGRAAPLKLLDPPHDAARIGSAIDVIAEKYKGVLGGEPRKARQQPLERGQVAVNVADGESSRGHAAKECNHHARGPLQTLRAVEQEVGASGWLVWLPKVTRVWTE